LPPRRSPPYLTSFQINVIDQLSEYAVREARDPAAPHTTASILCQCFAASEPRLGLSSLVTPSFSSAQQHLIA
jgi:hypothetical protein